MAGSQRAAPYGAGSTLGSSMHPGKASRKAALKMSSTHSSRISKSLIASSIGGVGAARWMRIQTWASVLMYT